MTIDSVRMELDEWRARRARGERVPEVLVAKIVGLTSQHRRGEIRRRLGLKNSFFSDHAPRSRGRAARSNPAAIPESAFVRIDPPRSAPGAKFEVELPGGMKVRFF